MRDFALVQTEECCRFGKQVAQRFQLLEISSDNVLDVFMY